MGRTIPLAIIYGTFLSLPSGQEKGLLIITFSYIAATVLFAILTTILHVKNTERTFKTAELLFIFLIIVLFLSNFFVAAFNNGGLLIWASRAIHIPMILFYWLILKYSDLTTKDVLTALFTIGLIETGLIYFTFLTGMGIQSERGTDIEGVIVYSVATVFAGYWALSLYNETRKARYVVIYFLILFGAILTGTRGLIVSVAVLMLVLNLNWIKLTAFLLTLAGTYYLLVGGFLDRFNIKDQDNLITVYSKLEEVAILYNLWQTNPFLGVGFGHEYQLSLAGSPYTYSHNALMFYLGYGGLMALPVFLWPLTQIWRSQPKAIWLVLGFLLFYTSSTTFTNMKHSMMMAAFVYVGVKIKARRNRQVYPKPLQQ